MARVYVYIDGFNLYYGIKRTKASKWLDPVALADRFFPEDEVLAVKYYTARVKARIDPGAPARQEVYIRAIDDNPRLSITYGQFRIGQVALPLVKPEEGKKWARVWKAEEKRSDVNLAAHLLTDAFESRFDIAAVVTNDSDLREPIRIVRNPPLGLKIHILNPTFGKPTEMGGGLHTDIAPGDYAACLLPNPVVLSDGTALTMPEEWAPELGKEEGPPAGDPMPG